MENIKERVNGSQGTKCHFMRPQQAAIALNVSRSQVYVLIKQGQLPAIKIGSEFRIPIAAIERMAARAAAMLDEAG